MGVTGTIEYARSPGTMLRAFREGVPEQMGRLGKHWHDRLLPKHFTQSGAREYGYQKRTVKYSKYKRKTRGHNNPLVWTGNLRRAVVGAYVMQTTGKGVKVKMKPPGYLYQYRLDTKAAPINKADEVVRVSQIEIDAMVKRLHDGLITRMNNTRKRETRVIR